MIKGIGKKVVVLTDPNSKIYEQAIFILRQNADEPPCDSDMLAEAERIINSHIFTSAALRSRRLPKTWWSYLVISISISLLVGASVLIFTLL